MEVKKVLTNKQNKKSNNLKEENLIDIEKLMKHTGYKRHRGALKQINY